MKSVKCALLAVLLMFPSVGFSQWWNPIGPRNYEDCVLEGMKTARSKDAVRAVQYACIEKFPPKERSPRAIQKQKEIDEALRKKCRVPEDSSGQSVIGIDSRRPKIQSAVDNLTALELQTPRSGRPRISFQNRNKFAVTAVAIGFTKLKNCPLNYNAASYEAIIICADVGIFPQGVGAGTYGTLLCQEEAKEFSMGYCTVGIKIGNPEDQADLVKTLDRNGLCD